MNNWLIFALSAPLLWGFTNVVDSVIRRKYLHSEFALTWFFAIFRLPFVLLIFAFTGIQIPDTVSVFFLFLAGAFWTIPFSLYYKAMENEEASRVALLLQMTPLFTLVIAFFLLGERLTLTQLPAFVLLILGGGLASLKRLEKTWHFSKAFWLIALATLLWAFSDVLFKKFEASFTHFLPAFAIYFFGSFVVALFMILPARGRAKLAGQFKDLPGRAWAFLIFSLVAGIFGSLSFAYALTLGKASLTSVLIGTQPLFVLGLGLLMALFISEIRKEELSKEALLVKGISFFLLMGGLVLLES